MSLRVPVQFFDSQHKRDLSNTNTSGRFFVLLAKLDLKLVVQLVSWEKRHTVVTSYFCNHIPAQNDLTFHRAAHKKEKLFRYP